jgi:hypothetical protein
MPKYYSLPSSRGDGGVVKASKPVLVFYNERIVRLHCNGIFLKNLPVPAQSSPVLPHKRITKRKRKHFFVFPRRPSAPPA